MASPVLQDPYRLQQEAEPDTEKVVEPSGSHPPQEEGLGDQGSPLESRGSIVRRLIAGPRTLLEKTRSKRHRLAIQVRAAPPGACPGPHRMDVTARAVVP